MHYNHIFLRLFHIYIIFYQIYIYLFFSLKRFNCDSKCKQKIEDTLLKHPLHSLILQSPHSSPSMFSCLISFILYHPTVIWIFCFRNKFWIVPCPFTIPIISFFSIGILQSIIFIWISISHKTAPTSHSHLK